MNMQLMMARARMNHQPPPSGGGFKYWRLFNTGVVVQGTDGVLSIAEMQFRATAGGSSLCIGGIPSASTLFSPALAAAKVFDGNASTYWASGRGGGVNEWLAYQLSASSEVNQVMIQGRGDYASQNPLVFKFQSSADGTTWADEWAPPTQSGWAYGEIRLFTRP